MNLTLVAIPLFSSLLIPIVSAISVGIWGGNGYQDTSQLEDLTNEYGFNVLVTVSKAGYAVNTLLPDAKAAGWKVVLRFADYETTDPDDTSDCTENGFGKFSYNAWEQSITTNLYFDEGKYEEVLNFIEDGTLLGVMLADDVRNYGDYGWDECDPTIEDIESMGKFIKDNFPGAKTWIRLAATELESRNGGSLDSLEYVDGAISQFTVKNSDPNTMPAYAIQNRLAAEALGVDVICGLNIADGGDGTSGQVGWSGAGFYAMSASEVLQYGSDFIDKTCCKYMLLWEYDGEEKWSDVDETIGADYFNADEDYKDSTLILSSTEECMCLDGEKYLHNIRSSGKMVMRKCSWLKTKSSSFIKKTCRRKIAYSITTLNEILSPAQAICRRTCDSCNVCFENKKTRYTQNVLSDGTKVFKRCKFLSNQNEVKKKKICSRGFSENGYPKPEDACPQTCSVAHCESTSTSD